VHQIPEVASNARGKAIVNLLQVEQGENVRALLTVKRLHRGKYVVMATRAGKIKKTELDAFSNVRATGIIAIDINEGDDLYAVRLSDGTARSSSARTTAAPSASTNPTSGRWAAAPPA
jgi:DNA gyrase subunit A